MTALDNKLYTVSIFLDLSKAFDTVNKDILLRKLDRFGFRDNINSFFESYLTDKLGGHDSTVKTRDAKKHVFFKPCFLCKKKVFFIEKNSF